MRLTHTLTTHEKLDILRKAHKSRPTIPATRIEAPKKAYDRSREKRETRAVIADVR